MHLGYFNLSGIPSQLAGEPSVSVTFKLDKNGVLNITATRAGAAEKSLQVTRTRQYFSATEVEDYLNTAAKNKEQDEKEAALLREFALLQALHKNVASFIEHASNEPKSPTESKTLLDVLGAVRCRRIKIEAQERALKLTKQDVKIRDLKFWQEKYQKEFKDYFGGQFPRFFCG